MDVRHFLTEASYPPVVAFAKKLKDAGIDFDDCYYTREGYRCDFFKIPKPFERENPNDPMVHYIFVDVEERDNGFGSAPEYSVYGNYAHDHFSDIDEAVRLIRGLLDETMVEIALSVQELFASTFFTHTGDYRDDISVLAENADAVMEILNNPLVIEGRGHMHTIFPQAYPYNLMSQRSKQFTYENINVYFLSSKFAHHPEIYIVS